MTSLIKELSEAQYQGLINGLEGGVWYQDMVSDTEAYDQLLLQKQGDAEDDKPGNTAEVYKDLRYACDELFDALEVLNKVTPDENYQAMVDGINRVTEAYQVTIKSRKTRSENEEGETSNED